MFLGHVAIGLAAKRVAPRASTAVLLGAPLLLDLLWPFFLLLGWERVTIDPGNTAFTPLRFESYPITHSLIAAGAWSWLAFLLYRYGRHYRRGALVVAGLVFSHWLFDFIVHRPDLPVIPYVGPYLGLGLWHSVAATVVLECVLFVAGIGMYLKATSARGVQGHLSFWLLIALLVAIYVGTVTGPPPPDTRTLAFISLTLWLIPLWGIWIERTRSVRTGSYQDS